METISYLALAVFFLILASFALALFVSVFKIGADRWKEASQLSGPMKNVLSGDVKADRDGLRDPRIAKGKVWKKATKSWHPQGKLSDDYVKNMVG